MWRESKAKVWREEKYEVRQGRKFGTIVWRVLSASFRSLFLKYKHYLGLYCTIFNLVVSVGVERDYSKEYFILLSSQQMYWYCASGVVIGAGNIRNLHSSLDSHYFERH